MSQTQYDIDNGYEYDTGQPYPHDSVGWQNFHTACKNNIEKWINGALPDIDDSAFFNIPYFKQKQLQRNHPALEEAWKIYITLLQVTNE